MVCLKQTSLDLPLHIDLCAIEYSLGDALTA